MIAVTARQGRLLSFIRGYSKSNGFAPSFREMRVALGSCTNAVNDDLETLESVGLVRRLRDRARAIEVTAPIIEGDIRPVPSPSLVDRWWR